MHNNLPIDAESLNKISDQQLISLAIANDQAALAALVKRYLKLVYSVARHYVPDADEAGDITQEVFIKIWKNLEKFQPGKKFSSWAYEIAKNTAIDWCKKKKPLSLSELARQAGKTDLTNVMADTSPGPFDQAAKAGLISSVRTAAAQLSLSYQEVLTMHHEKDLTFQEIAESTGEPLNTVKSRYRRALVLLKEILGRNQ